MGTLSDTVQTMQLLADPTRVRLLGLLAHWELTVAELTRVTQLPQSRVSTHLGKLREASWVRDRRQGTSSFYAFDQECLPAGARGLWSAMQEGLEDVDLAQDLRRAEAVVEARAASKPWPDAVAGEMERHYSPGRTWEAMANGLLGLVDLGEVLDIGSGDGVNAELLAARARRWTCLDASERVIAAAKRRLARSKSGEVDFVVADMHRLPFGVDSFDQVLMFHVLTYSRDPARAIVEAARVLRGNGRLAIVTLRRHEHRDVARGYDHVNDGVSVDGLRAWLEAAQLEVEDCQVSSRERRKPYFQIITAFARKRS